MINALTIDVEDYYQVSAFEGEIDYSDWDRFESRVSGNTERLLGLLAEHNMRATFFVLGCIAQKQPALLRMIRKEGHEIGCHGLRHVRINTQSPEEFRKDVREAKASIESALGEPVKGYRAASFSLRDDTLWALEVLVEEGFEFDSSIFPVLHDRYGIPGAPRFPFVIKTPSGPIAELPLTTRRLFGHNFPIAGGGYFRLLPYAFIRNSMRAVNDQEGTPCIFYFHPWEIDTGQPRQKTTWLSRIRHYHNIDKMEGRLHRLLTDLRFTSISEAFRSYRLRTFQITRTEGKTLFEPTEENLRFLGSRPQFSTKKLSVVIPVYNEAENLAPLCTELRQALAPLPFDSEWIFVDDGSTDDSVERLKRLSVEFPAIKVVKLRGNFGQTQAMQAGFTIATGDAVASMDGDLQNDPADIPVMIQRLEEGYDLVCGWRKERKDAWLSRRFPSLVANRLIRVALKSTIHDRGCSLKAYRSELVKAFRLYSDMHRFLQEVSVISGARVSELVVNHRARRYGKTKYGISRTFKVLADLCALKMIIRFRSKPLLGFSLIAFPFAVLSALIFGWSAWIRLTSDMQEFPAVDVSVGILFLTSFLFLMMLGFIGELAINAPNRTTSRSDHLVFEERKQ